jgi:hypothetical protein
MGNTNILSAKMRKLGKWVAGPRLRDERHGAVGLDRLVPPNHVTFVSLS